VVASVKQKYAKPAETDNTDSIEKTNELYRPVNYSLRYSRLTHEFIWLCSPMYLSMILWYCQIKY